MLMKILESILTKVGESFLSRVEEQTADNAFNNVKSIKEFKLILITLQKNLKSLCAKASDVEEEIKNAERSGQKKRKREVEEWLGEVKAIEKEVVDLGTLVDSEGFIRRLIDGGKIAQLNEQVDKLVEQSRNFGELLLDVCGTGGVTLLTTKMVGEAFQENLKKIWRILETGEVSRIGVHGMGGAGKSTLAKHIHNRLWEQSQVRVFWVTVSENFTIKSLQDKIARCLGIKLLDLDEDDEDIRASRLHGVLSQEKKSVVILDDVWENIDPVKLGCSVPVECCRLIITTRSLEVCRRIGCEEVIAVKKLDEDEAWKLFIETLGKETKLGPQEEEIAKCVARLCDGLPLGIVTMAGSMRGVEIIHTWRNALAELKEPAVGQDGLGEVEVFRVLKYSFNRLNTNGQSQSNDEFNLFQLCFLYCSFYPEDHKISRKKLFRKLISEGLLDQSKSRREQFDKGHVVLDKLVNVCLLESCVRYKGVECVKMHDLVRGMALKIGKGKYMVKAGDYSFKEIPEEEEWTKDLEKVSLMWNEIRRIGEGTSPNCPKLSTLLLQGNPLEVIPDSFFSKMQGLCTLDLCHTRISMLPNSISELKSLKALLLKGCEWLEYVPYLGKLKALRKLNLDYTAIKEVPQGVEELLNLKFLSIDALKLEMLPEGLLVKLVGLEYVKFPFHVQVPVQGIKNLKQVERFWGRVKNVRDFNCYVESRQIPVHDAFYNILVREEEYSDEEVYIGDNDRELILSECSLNDEKVLGQDIEALTIVSCEGLSNCFLDHFSPSNYPSSLKKLEIQCCEGIECILTSDRQELPFQFSNLEDIMLEELEDLKGLMIQKAGEIGASPAPAQPLFSSLTRLIIDGCDVMKKLGLPISGFPNLEVIAIQYCSEIEEIFEDEGRASLTLPKLRVLSVSELPRLESVCKATIICNSIEEISIVRCPGLMKKLPLHLDDPPPPTLSYIWVEREWWESLEWDNPNLPTLLQPTLKFLS